jgi:two-component system, chemotaxis family, protein-glutamate methylesterase/glutaminase
VTVAAVASTVSSYPRTARVIALAASAGGLEALSQVLEGLPPTIHAAILIVQHLDPHRPSHLASILARRSGLPVKQAAEHDHLVQGCAYVAPPDAHLMVSSDGELSLSNTPPVHHVRPSADQLFESMAQSFGPRAIAVVLTGMGTDGASGAQAIKQQGGVVIVQDEATSAFFGMPGAAIAAGEVDRILPLRDIPAALAKLVGVRMSS